jgi:hypothetical protein
MQSQHEWRCSQCGKLLGVLRDGRIHIRFSKSHDYLVSAPATGICRGCGTLNEHALIPASNTQGAARGR